MPQHTHHFPVGPLRNDRFGAAAGSRFGWREETAADPHGEDPETRSWSRTPSDPNVLARLEHIREHSGIKGLEICSPHEVERIVQLFERDGFCVVRDVLKPDQLQRMQRATEDAQAEELAASRGDIRYSFNSHSQLHKKAWCELVDLDTTTPILTAIFNSTDYTVWGAGGDYSLPGTFEYQSLHRDVGEGDFFDRSGKLKSWDLPPFCVTLNFPMVDFNADAGPIRHIPGTQKTRDPPPLVPDEPE